MILKTIVLSLCLNGSDSLPYKDSLFASLRRFHNEAIQMEMTELEVKEKGKVWKWLPSVGMGTTYTARVKTDAQTGQAYIQNVPRFGVTLGYNLETVHKNINEKTLNEAKKLKIIRGDRLSFKRDSFTLVGLLHKLEAYKRSLVTIEQSDTIEQELFTEQKKRYSEGLILPIDWLQIQNQHIKAGEAYFKKLEEMDLLIIEIFLLAKY